ncbi:MAG: molybdenum cofactor biosynthesis protein MoaE [Candidatus Kapaibacterium sp.]|jgi:molybdopterin synthase catalytic subunit
MSTQIEIVLTPINREQYAVKSPPHNAGAIVEFFGVVREDEAGSAIQGIDYEAFRDMAEHQLQLLIQKAIGDHDLLDMLCVHRIGFVPVGAPSLYIRITSSHRAEAFAAMTEFIDKLKKLVPIWKHPIPKDQE